MREESAFPCGIRGVAAHLDDLLFVFAAQR